MLPSDQAPRNNFFSSCRLKKKKRVTSKIKFIELNVWISKFFWLAQKKQKKQLTRSWVVYVPLEFTSSSSFFFFFSLIPLFNLFSAWPHKLPIPTSHLDFIPILSRLALLLYWQNKLVLLSWNTNKSRQFASSHINYLCSPHASCLIEAHSSVLKWSDPDSQNHSLASHLCVL